MIEQPNNPLHGIKLEMILESLVELYGWDVKLYYIKEKNVIYEFIFI